MLRYNHLSNTTMHVDEPHQEPSILPKQRFSTSAQHYPWRSDANSSRFRNLMAKSKRRRRRPQRFSSKQPLEKLEALPEYPSEEEPEKQDESSSASISNNPLLTSLQERLKQVYTGDFVTIEAYGQGGVKRTRPVQPQPTKQAFTSVLNELNDKLSSMYTGHFYVVTNDEEDDDDERSVATFTAPNFRKRLDESCAIFEQMLAERKRRAALAEDDDDCSVYTEVTEVIQVLPNGDTQRSRVSGETVLVVEQPSRLRSCVSSDDEDDFHDTMQAPDDDEDDYTEYTVEESVRAPQQQQLPSGPLTSRMILYDEVTVDDYDDEEEETILEEYDEVTVEETVVSHLTSRPFLNQQQHSRPSQPEYDEYTVEETVLEQEVDDDEYDEYTVEETVVSKPPTPLERQLELDDEASLAASILGPLGSFFSRKRSPQKTPTKNDLDDSEHAVLLPFKPSKKQGFPALSQFLQKHQIKQQQQHQHLQSDSEGSAAQALLAELSFHSPSGSSKKPTVNGKTGGPEIPSLTKSPGMRSPRKEMIRSGVVTSSSSPRRAVASPKVASPRVKPGFVVDNAAGSSAHDEDLQNAPFISFRSHDEDDDCCSAFTMEDTIYFEEGPLTTAMAKSSSNTNPTTPRNMQVYNNSLKSHRTDKTHSVSDDDGSASFSSAHEAGRNSNSNNHYDLTRSPSNSSSVGSTTSATSRRLAKLLRTDVWSRDAGVVQSALQEIAQESVYPKQRNNIVKFGGLLAIIRAMEMNHDHVGIHVAACQALEMVALDHENQVALGEVGGMHALVESMRRHDNVQVQVAACSALANLTKACGSMEELVEEGAVETIAQTMMRYDEPKIQEKGFLALSHLCVDNKERLMELSRSGGLAAMTVALQKPWESKADKHEAISTLSILLRSLAECESH